MTVVTEPCRECGTPTEREDVDGPFGRLLSGVPLLCQSCNQRSLDAYEEEERIAEQRREREAVLARIHHSGLPEPRRQFRLRELDASGPRERVIADAERWAAGRIPALLLSGGVGVGKSTIAAAAAMDRLQRGPVRWITALEFTAGLSAPFESHERRETQKLMSTKPTGQAPRPLIVDDLDKARGTEYVAEGIFGLIDACEAVRRPLIVTTNLRPSELVNKWPAPIGESVASRLAGYCVLHELGGHDRRLSRRPA